MRDLSCLRCGEKMAFIQREKIQLGQTGWILGDLPNLAAGAMEVDIYSCPGCGKIEFFQPAGASTTDDELPQKRCPGCGKMIDFDYPKCPFCKYDFGF